MTRVLHAMQQRWSTLATRDQRILIAMIILIAILLFIVYAWLPLTRSRAQLEVQIPQLRAALSTMQQEALELTRISALPPATQKRNALDAAAIKQAFGPNSSIGAVASTEATAGSSASAGINVHISSIAYTRWLDQLGVLQAATGATLLAFEIKANALADNTQSQTASVDMVLAR